MTLRRPMLGCVNPRIAAQCWLEHMRIPPTRPRWEQAMERVVCELGPGVLKDSGRAAKVRADGGCAMIVKGWGDCPEPGLTTT